MENHGIESFSVLDEAKYSKFYRLLIWTTAMGAFLDVYTTTNFGGSAFAIRSYFNISGSFFGFLIGVSFFMGLVGALTLGALTDRLGRRFIFLLDMFIIILGSIVGALATTVSGLYANRILIGFGVGGDFAAALTLLSEYAPKGQRGKMIGSFFIVMQISAAFGVALSTILAYIIGAANPMLFRIMLATGVVPAVIGIILRARTPESPRWLALKGKLNEAASSIKKSIGIQVNPDALSELSTSAGNKSKMSNLKQVFSIRYVRVLLGIIVLSLLPTFIIVSLTSLNPIIFAALGLSGNKSLLFSLPFYFSLVFGAAAYRGLTDKLGRRKLFLYGSLPMGISIIIAGLMINYISVVVVMEFIFGFCQGIWFCLGIGWAIELYPTELRGTVGGFQTAINRLGLFVGVSTAPLVIAWIGDRGLFLLFGPLNLIGILLGYVILGPKGESSMKTLEEASIFAD